LRQAGPTPVISVRQLTVHGQNVKRSAPEEKGMIKLLARLWHEEDGQDLTEYALLLVLLVLAAIGSLSGLAIAVNGVFVNTASNLSTPT
jgi:Flp pilus assembly pilin Flp